jgi:integrase
MARTKQGTPPSYKYHKSGQAVVEIDGKSKYLGRYGSPSSWLLYAKLISEKAGDGAGSSPSADPSLSVSGLVALWKEWAIYYYRDSPSTVESHLFAFKRLLLSHADEPASSFSRTKLVSLRKKMIADGMARSSVNEYVKRVKRLFSWAVDEDRRLVPDSVASSLALLKGLKENRSEARETEDVGPVGVDLVEKTLTKLSGEVVSLVRVHLLTGARPGELCRLEWPMIEKGEDVWKVDLKKHKTRVYGKRRFLFFGERAREEMEKLPHPRRFVFLSRRGRPFEVESYRKLVEEACKKAGVNHWHPNQLRHTYATEVRRRFGLEAAQVSLGHSSAKTTEIYAERDMALAEKVAKEMG